MPSFCRPLLWCPPNSHPQHLTFHFPEQVPTQYRLFFRREPINGNAPKSPPSPFRLHETDRCWNMYLETHTDCLDLQRSFWDQTHCSNSRTRFFIRRGLWASKDEKTKTHPWFFQYVAPLLRRFITDTFALSATVWSEQQRWLRRSTNGSRKFKPHPWDTSYEHHNMTARTALKLRHWWSLRPWFCNVLISFRNAVTTAMHVKMTQRCTLIAARRSGSF